MKLDSDRQRQRRVARLRAFCRKFAATPLILIALVSACAVRPALPPDFETAGAEVSLSVLESHLAVLGGFTPRKSGSSDDVRAREYITRAFSAAGALPVPPAEGNPHFVAVMPGESEKSILLLAGVNATGAGARDASSTDVGTALLLELARVFGERRPRFTLYFALLGVPTGESACADRCRDSERGPSQKTCSGGDGPEALVAARRSRCRLIEAGASLADRLSAAMDQASFRAAFAFVLSADPELRFGGDLRSHPVYRDLFWETARDMGATSIFPIGSDWRTAEALHAAYDRLAPGRLLILADEDRSNRLALSPDENPSGTAIASVARVSVAALEELMARFAKVDRFRGARRADE